MGGLKSQKSPGAEELDEANAVVDPPDMTGREPGGRIAVENDGALQAHAAPSLPRIDAGRARARCRIRENRGNERRWGGDIPGQLSGVEVVRAVERKAVVHRDVRRRAHPRQVAREINAIERSKEPEAVLQKVTAKVHPVVEAAGGRVGQCERLARLR